MSLPTTIALNDGHRMPVVGFGTFQSKPDEVGQAVATALEAGYRHIDCASIYGNEKEVGQAIRSSGIAREEIFITSKLWNNNHHPDDVEAALDATLADLGLNYVDLYLIHWPVVFKRGEKTMPIDKDGFFILEDIPLVDTWGAMEKVLATGKTKSIGVSNYNIRRLEELLAHATIVPVVNQIEAHPYLQQSELMAFCKSKNIVVQAYSPMGNNETNSPRAIDDPDIKDLAKQAGLDVGQLLVSWAVQRGTVVLPKSVTTSRIRTNLAVRKLPSDIFDALSAKEKHHRCNFPARWGFNVFDELSSDEVARQAKQMAADNLQIFS